MTKISAGSIFFVKRVFPALWFGFIVVVAGVAVMSVIAEGPELSHLPFLLIPVILAIIGYLVMSHLVWDLVDEVWDHGDYLVIKNRGDEARVDLADIMNLNATTAVNPPRITLRLRRPSRFGTEVSFSPVRPFTLNPFARNEVAEDLILRIDRARSQRVG